MTHRTILSKRNCYICKRQKGERTVLRFTGSGFGRFRLDEWEFKTGSSPARSEGVETDLPWLNEAEVCSTGMAVDFLLGWVGWVGFFSPSEDWRVFKGAAAKKIILLKNLPRKFSLSTWTISLVNQLEKDDIYHDTCSQETNFIYVNARRPDRYALVCVAPDLAQAAWSFRTRWMRVENWKFKIGRRS